MTDNPLTTAASPSATSSWYQRAQAFAVGLGHAGMSPSPLSAEASTAGSTEPPRRSRRGTVLLVVVALAALVATLVLVPVSPGPPQALEPLPATAMTEAGSQALNSPVLAVDPTDERFVVLANRADAPDFGCGLQISGDGGRGFVTAAPVPDLPEGAEKCYAPEVAFDAEGRLYYLFVGLSGRGNAPMGVFLTTSDDRGQSFSAPRPVLGPQRYQVRMAIDTSLGVRGRIHLVWLQPGGPPGNGSLPSTTLNPIMAAFSDDGGKRFSPPVRVSDPGRQRVVAPALALGPDQTVHVMYYDLQDDARDYQGLAGPTWDGAWSLVTASSTDGGASFGGGVVVENEVTPPGRVILIFTMPPPALAADASGRVFAAWPDARFGDPDVLVRASTDGGRSWGEAVRVNDDAVGNGRTQALPRLSVAPGGRVDALFYDRRDDPADLANHAMFSSSTDGGRSFGPNLQLTEVTSDSRVGKRYEHPAAEGLVEFGSRLAVASSDDAALVAWTDTRNANRFDHQEIFATQVEMPGPGALATWALVALALAASAAVGLRFLKNHRGSGGRPANHEAGR